ncbi:DUF4329 domain-containing protein [Pseudomonas khavaziana]|uniref:DUF4329 domain-containing protein n=1 Tax=Pseudomonas khavaziana TaxID=2842351 RepID=UPI001C3D021F|nr:DUF4329 domain-containing protein [Pseudomonas khavaziana]MBV4480346.1 DUF4329 domain-containing protein [Pseudomonas khavaziana]
MEKIPSTAAHPSNQAVHLPLLSPPFISADDAAYWAHEQIGDQRDREYGGVILKRENRYAATTPQPGKTSSFTLNEVFATADDGTLILPSGYTCAAIYHSHPLDYAAYEGTHFTADERTLLLGFFSPPDMQVMIRFRHIAGTHYLSGPEGSLLKYVASGSPKELAFLKRLDDGDPGDMDLHEDVIPQLAEAGEFSVLVANAVWGGVRGRVDKDWRMGERLAGGQALQPLFTSVFPGRDLEKLLPMNITASARPVFGYVLKAIGKDEYIAPVPAWEQQRLVPPEGLFMKRAEGRARLPSNFRIDRVYCRVQPKEVWQHKYFFTPSLLAAALAQWRADPALYDPHRRLTLMLRSADGALLSYTFSGSEAEAQFLSDDGNVVEKQMKEATFTPAQFVEKMARLGELNVVQVGTAWPRAGRFAVAPPALEKPSPRLSPAFISADDAACWAHAAIGERRDVEYGGVILKRAGRYYATHPVPDQRNSFDHGLVLAKDSEGRFIAPGDYVAEAFYHSHPADAAQIQGMFPSFTADQVLLFNNYYSVADQLFSFKQRAFAKTHYFSGPDNVLLKYVSSGSTTEKKLEQQLRDGTLEPASDFEHLIWKLAEAGELWVIIAHPVWGGVRGRITHGWRIRMPATVVQQLPFFTAVFPTPETAVLRALLLAGASDQGAKVGFVLKHSREDAYVATLATPKRQPLFSLNEVFPKRPNGKLRLPSHYRLEAIYFTSFYQTHEVAAREKWLASTFFTPAQIVAATRQARGTLEIQNPGRGLSLYMQASDGALLAFKVPEATSTSELVRQGSEGELNDNGAQAALLSGTLSPRDYVRRVIAATELAVVQAGGLWRKVGSVDNRSDLLTSFYKATLSRSFLSARDAAVYAHEQIGNWRDRYYGGYVLKGEDGRFVITEPIASAANPFAFTLFFPLGHAGPLIPPEPYVLHGRYGSHLALSMADPVAVAQRGWTRDEAQINQQVFSTAEIYSIIPAGRPAYLSGAQDCLLEFTPNNSSQESLLLANLGPQAGDNSLGKRLDSGRIRPADWVWRLAEAADLRVIEGNALWGPRSVVYNDWTPNYTYAPRSGPPDYVTYGAVFPSADEAANNLHGRVHGRNYADSACFAFILKHKEQEQYIASQIVGVTAQDALFNLNRLFERKDGGGYRLPDGFEVHGLFRSQQWSPAGLNTSNAWLTLFFVTPDVLYTAIFAADRAGVKKPALYFSTLDGALLRYVPAPLDVSSGGPADTLLTQAQEQLNSGQKPPLDFLREWVLKGMLTVVRTSQYWDKKGVVAATWGGYETLMPRRLSPSFASADDAARHAAARLNNGYRRAYGGVVLRLVNGLFVATEPLALPPQGFALNWIYPEQTVAAGLYPGGSTIVARYRSLVDQEVPMLLSATEKAIYQTMIPSAVLGSFLHRERYLNREYVFGARGSILSYQLSSAAEESLLMQRVAPLNPVRADYGDNLIEQQIRSGALSPADFVTQVAKAGELRVVEGDRVWGPPRTVKVSFLANQPQTDARAIRAVFLDPPCGPLFTQAYDAVRHAQRLYKPQAEVAFGYVLKSVNKPLYMTTLALVREDLADLTQVFVGGQLPQGYVLDGLYLCASTVAIASADDEMAHSFFAPPAIVKALSFLTYARNGESLPLYLVCADGALLKYVLPRSTPLHRVTGEAHLDRTRLLEGTLKVRDYVRRLASAGELHVRVNSEIWGRKERVTANWVPKKTPHALVDDPFFHSFCGPLFFYPDDAAHYAQGLVAPFQSRQYLGAVLEPEPGQGYVAIEPVEDQGLINGMSTLARFFWIGHAGFDVPAGHVLGTHKIVAVHRFYKAIASTSSHEQIDKDLLENFVSKDDLRDSLVVIKNNAPRAESCYLSCRGGALLKYVPALSLTESRLLSSGPAPAPHVLVNQLRVLGKLSVLMTDAFWTRIGPLDREWSSNGVRAEPPTDEFWYARTKDEL